MASPATPTATSILVLALTVVLVGSVRVAAGAPVDVTAAELGATESVVVPTIVDPTVPIALSTPTASYVDAAPEAGSPAPLPIDPAPAIAPPAPAPGPVPVPTEAPPMTTEQRVTAALEEAVPARWREILPVQSRVVDGATSYARYPNLIEVGQRHLDGPWTHLVSVISHEFGHLIAFSYGTGAFDGAAPDGWPDPGYAYPAESWADCVAQAFTGIIDPSYGMPACPDGSLQWTGTWLNSFPDR